LTNREIFSWALFNTKFLIERCLYLNFGNLAGSWPLKPMERRGLKLESTGFFNISMEFLIDRVPSCRILEFWVFGRIRQWATGADDHMSQIQNNHCAETLLTSNELLNVQFDSRNSSYARKSVFFLARVLVKA
jgi:hypothetical protein